MRPEYELARAWLAKARNDLVTGQRALAGDPPICDTACFHAQQAVEKGLKAVLVLRKTAPPRTHNISVLLKRCGMNDERLHGMSGDLRWLTAFAVDVRYADVGDEPTIDHARKALAVAERALGIIVEAMPPEVRP